jgi:hypothetical protein
VKLEDIEFQNPSQHATAAISWSVKLFTTKRGPGPRGENVYFNIARNAERLYWINTNHRDIGTGFEFVPSVIAQAVLYYILETYGVEGYDHDVSGGVCGKPDSRQAGVHRGGA